MQAIISADSAVISPTLLTKSRTFDSLSSGCRHLHIKDFSAQASNMICEYSRKICSIREDFDKKREIIEINI